MKIAFHTPLNRYGDGAPSGDPPSGDRLMARQLVTLLGELGHAVEVVPAQRSFMRDPDPALLAAHGDAAQGVIASLTERWRASSRCKRLEPRRPWASRSTSPHPMST